MPSTRVGGRVWFYLHSGGRVMGTITHVTFWDVVDIKLDTGEELVNIRAVLRMHVSGVPNMNGDAGRFEHFVSGRGAMPWI